MNVKFDVIDIRLTELHTQRTKTPQWETPVLLAIHGENVTQVGDVVLERNVPEARDEFARLAQRYGPKVGDTPYVASVYGNFGPGIGALDRAIKAAVVAEKSDEPRAEADVLTPTVAGLPDAEDVSDLMGDAEAA